RHERMGPGVHGVALSRMVPYADWRLRGIGRGAAAHAPYGPDRWGTDCRRDGGRHGDARLLGPSRSNHQRGTSLDTLLDRSRGPAEALDGLDGKMAAARRVARRGPSVAELVRRARDPKAPPAAQSDAFDALVERFQAVALAVALDACDDVDDA